jgi:hypothetical protein
MQELMKKEGEDLPNQIYDIVMHKLGDDIKDIVLKYLAEEKAHKKEIQIPISIFKTILPPLEALVRYLKENQKLRFSEIAQKLNRDDRTIWVTYRNSLSKYVEFTIDETIQIPLSVLADRNLSVLEHVSKYLKESYNYSNKKIAILLDKDESTIWTVYNRAKIKCQNFPSSL